MDTVARLIPNARHRQVVEPTILKPLMNIVSSADVASWVYCLQKLWQMVSNFKTQYLSWIVANNSRNLVFDIASRVLENRPFVIIVSAFFFGTLPLISLPSFYKHIVFLAKNEFSYFSANFRLENFLWIFLDYQRTTFLLPW